MAIRHYLKDNSAFEPDAITAMFDALERTCQALQVNGHIRDREVIAARIVDLARNGAIDAVALSGRVVAEVRAMRVSYRLLYANEVCTEAEAQKRLQVIGRDRLP